MNYKTMLLSALLLSPAIISCDVNVETRIKELKDAQFKKELELSNLGEMIDKKYEFLNSYRSNALSHWAVIQEKKIEDLQKKNGLSKEQCINAKSEIETLFEQFIKNLEEAFDTSGDIKKIIEKELSAHDNYELLRIVLLRVVLEKRLVENLIVKYDPCVHELIKINKDLTNLRK